MLPIWQRFCDLHCYCNAAGLVNYIIVHVFGKNNNAVRWSS